MMDDFVDELLDSVKAILAQIVGHNFTQQMIEGTLPEDIFHTYLAKDCWYLQQFSSVLKKIEERQDSPLAGCGLADYIVQAEALIEKEIIKKKGIKTFDYDIENENKISQFTPPKSNETIVRYIRHLRGAADNLNLSAAIAACLPCFWVYMKIGEQYIDIESPDQDYRNWMSTYRESEFISMQKKLLDALRQEGNDEGVRDAFNTSICFERDFFTSVMESVDELDMVHN